MSPGDVAAVHELGRRGFSDVRAFVSERAASLRGLLVEGVELVHGTLDPDPPLAAGVVLVPWPNRVEEGRWMLDGTPRQLELTEPELGNANHGLLSRTRYTVVERDHDHIRLTAPVVSSAGYPFDLDTSVVYRVADRGIVVRHEITNRSERAAPVAIGAHPYLRLGADPVDSLVLTINATHALDLDDRHIPRGEFEVEGTSFDLRQGKRVGDAVDHACYTGLGEQDGLVVHTLRTPDGREMELWADPVFAYVQVYVTQDFPGIDGHEVAVAVEPMTAPPNALRSGVGLRWVDPGATWVAEWGIRLR